jgi:uncharacterized low-complexity protein
MNQKQSRLQLVAGAAVAASFAIGSVAHAADNPFVMQKLDSGYQLAQADKKADGKCGEGKCGGAKKAEEKKKDGKCGEAKCGADKKAGDDKGKEGKSGEAKCGAAKK